jgi:hypothetical protein
MGDPLKSISRSSSQKSGIVQKVEKTNKVGDKKNRLVPNKKKLTKKVSKSKTNRSKVVKDKVNISKDYGIEAEFEKNIMDQTTESSEEVDRLFRATLKNESRGSKPVISPKERLKNSIQESVKKHLTMKGVDISKELDTSSVDGVSADLESILKTPEKRVSKGFTTSEIQKKDVLKIRSEGEPVKSNSTMSIGSGTHDYDYGTIEMDTILFNCANFGTISIKKLGDNPAELHDTSPGITKVFYVDKNHPLTKKVCASFGGIMPIIPIKGGMLNDLLFGTVLEKLYTEVGEYCFDRNTYKLCGSGYIANIVLSSGILYYEDAAYYTFFEKVDRDKIENMILISVDIIFSI